MLRWFEKRYTIEWVQEVERNTISKDQMATPILSKGLRIGINLKELERKRKYKTFEDVAKLYNSTHSKSIVEVHERVHRYAPEIRHKYFLLIY